MVVVNETAKGFWEAQYFADDHITIEEDVDYVVRLTAKASAEASINCILGGWSGAKDQKITIPTEWKTINARLSGITPGDAHVMLQSGDFVGTLWIQKCEVLKIVKANSIPLTPEEKKDTLIWAMDRWIKGMMEACEGKVKAWDVVNEAISGGNPDAEGVYALQHDLEGTKPEDFYWQDYLGDYDYVRTAVRLAREYGPEDIKLFINDYNLEYEWHGNDNKKLQSLIKWIERWESDGVTKIDGIGTQTHISFCADPDIQKKHEELIKNSFQLMANTGKLIRISELDMGYDDANGNKVMTVDMTEEMHKQMSDFYKWIIKTYMEIIPAAQQWGICQWCIKDSPTGSGWRPGEPTGLWMVKKELNGNEVVYRKHTYGGFADGLAGKE
jgi:GH35 family endo-1,4-beta-xylanase